MPTFTLNFSRPGQRGDRPVLHVHQPGVRGLPAGPAAILGHRPVPGGGDRRARAVRPAQRWPRPSGLRGRPRSRYHQLHGVRRVGPPPRARLAGAGLHLPREPRGSGRPAGGGPGGHDLRHGRPSAHRPAGPHRRPGVAGRTAPRRARRGPSSLRPLARWPR